MIATVLFAIAFTVCFALHEKFRIKDEQTADLTISGYLKKQWHKYKGGVQIVVFAFVFYVSFERHLSYLYASGITLFSASFFWIFHDGLLNTFLFKKEWWYVGSTGSIDRKYGRIMITVAKLASMAASITMLLIWLTYC